VAAGFVGFEITWRKDVFSSAPQAGSAEKFGTLGINFRTRKAANEEEWTAAMAALSCGVPAQETAEGLAEKPLRSRRGGRGCARLLPLFAEGPRR
jgi:hypothetical protein